MQQSKRTSDICPTGHTEKLDGSPHNKQTQSELTRGTVTRANQKQKARAVAADHLLHVGQALVNVYYPEKNGLYFVLCCADRFICSCTQAGTTYFLLFLTHAAGAIFVEYLSLIHI